MKLRPSEALARFFCSLSIKMPPRRSCRSFHLDLAFHGGMQAADVVVDSRIRERELSGLALQDNGGAKPLGAGKRHLMRRGVGVEPGDLRIGCDHHGFRAEL